MPIDLRIRILHGRDDARHSRIHQGPGAWPRSPLVRAWLERGIDGGSSCGRACLLQSNDLGMTDAIVGVDALTDDLAVLNYDGSHHRARACKAGT